MKIGIYLGTDKDINCSFAAKVIEVIFGKAAVMMHEHHRETLSNIISEEMLREVSFVSFSELVSKPDIMIVLGGDGTILKAARACAGGEIPLLGINLGRIGYMAELEIDELPMLERLIDGDYRVEKRMMLEADIGGERLFALNEAVLGGESIFRIVDIELSCDGKPVNKYRADGLIVSTPTGSTAYSMSAGGAVVDPRMDAMIITPICSHSLNATPLVFSAESEITMTNVSEREGVLYLNVDGSETRTLSYGDSVTVRRCDKVTRLVRLKDGGFYEVLRHKMSDRH